jgi:hypothetical protein
MSNEISREFLNQSKKMSQLIAKSWLPNDPEAANIKKVLMSRNSDEIKALMKNYGIDPEGFLGPTKVVVDWNSYKGVLTEEVGEMVYSLPYPPRPTEVTDEQLEEWVNNTDPNTQYPTTPYIPLSFC